MPLWDSVQRSLEKASQAAARKARTQRLRSSIDGLTRQINTQHNNILNKAMDMFVAGQLTSSELYPLCQEMMNLQQELFHARNELQQLQAQASQAQPATPQVGGPPPPLPPGQGAPPEYQSYLDSTSSMTVPPPPPGVESLTISAMETVEMNQGVPTSAPICSNCQTELFPNNAFCHSCGAPVQLNDSQHQPTMRAGSLEDIYPGEAATMRADEPAHPSPPSSQIQQSSEKSAQNEEV